MGDLTHGLQWSSLRDSGIGGCASHIGCTKGTIWICKDDLDFVGSRLYYHTLLT